MLQNAKLHMPPLNAADSALFDRIASNDPDRKRSLGRNPLDKMSFDRKSLAAETPDSRRNSLCEAFEEADNSNANAAGEQQMLQDSVPAAPTDHKAAAAQLWEFKNARSLNPIAQKEWNRISLCEPPPHMKHLFAAASKPNMHAIDEDHCAGRAAANLQLLQGRQVSPPHVQVIISSGCPCPQFFACFFKID